MIIAAVSLNDGQFLFQPQGLPLVRPSRDGKYNFRYSSMPNAKFVSVGGLDKLMGLSVGITVGGLYILSIVHMI